MALRSFKEFNNVVTNVFYCRAYHYQNEFSAAMMSSIAWHTPIDRGFAKGNWNAAIDDINPVPSTEIDRTRTGLRARRKANRQLRADERRFNITRSEQKRDPSQMGLGRKMRARDVYIKNGVVGQPRQDGRFGDSEGNGYIIQLEEGKSAQAPVGMVLITIAQRRAIARAALRRMR